MTTKGYVHLIQKEGKGIYIFELNEDNGEIQSVDTGYDIEASTYLAQTEQFLYAITKENEACGVAAFKKTRMDSLHSLINV